MNKGTLKQILLITDGGSNQGESPVESASYAFDLGIVVNVIGVLDRDETIHRDSYEEVEAIALAGGGVSQIVYEEALSQTVQAVTHQAMSQTLQGIVHQELSAIFGREQTLHDLTPEKRGEVLEVVEDLGEMCNLEVLILVDTSASMHSKIRTVKEALIDLSYSLQARTGENEFSIYQFPDVKHVIRNVTKWSNKIEALSVVFSKLKTGGLTPTGPAIREAVKCFSRKRLEGSMERERFTEEG